MHSNECLLLTLDLSAAKVNAVARIGKHLKIEKPSGGFKLSGFITTTERRITLTKGMKDD